MKTIGSKIVISALLLGALALPNIVSADNLVNQRLENQHARIIQGNRTGELTRRKDRRLGLDESRIRYQTASDRYRDGGHLTTFQRSRIESELNRSSATIYREKHNDHVRVGQ